jgi:hypothetical protein
MPYSSLQSKELSNTIKEKRMRVLMNGEEEKLDLNLNTKIAEDKE